MAGILVIEDDLQTAQQLAAELARGGHQVRHAADGLTGLECASRGRFDVITMDRMLPRLDGLAVIGRLRRAGVQTPVLVLSALDAVDERVRGLRCGGDDYLAKPFALAEFSARVESLLRRAPEPRPTLLRVGELELDLLARRARRGARPLELKPREFAILEYLARNAGRMVTRRMVFENVWDYRFDPGTNVIDVHLGRLRRQVDQAGEPPLLETRRGIGFMLRAPA